MGNVSILILFFNSRNTVAEFLVRAAHERPVTDPELTRPNKNAATFWMLAFEFGFLSFPKLVVESLFFGGTCGKWKASEAGGESALHLDFKYGITSLA